MRTVLLVLLFAATATARPQATGFDPPQARRTATIGKSALTDPPLPVRQECLVYKAFALLTVEDPGMKGGTVRVRQRTPAMALDKLCAPGGDARLLGEQLGHGWGMSGDVVFVLAPDAFGVVRGVALYRATTGERLLQAEFDLTRPFVVRQGSVTFHRPIDVPCLPTQEDSACWQRIRARNKIPDEVRLKAPDCRRALKAHPGVTPEALQLTAPVRVDLAHPEEQTFVDGEVTCTLAP